MIENNLHVHVHVTLVHQKIYEVSRWLRFAGCVILLITTQITR